mmetsp:Transcript_83215/g.239224  ORF Transcript_83215/g.239224 Transcript_83215/m.239224 type:complete len:317 (-) Transcript_83215:267-1217(-)|eukprot:CAMPEP_0177322296 /NCGR_PEP_ID=MMETSP0368-20130122/16127_1 /TAXON_ID=447022 ORGANISM="Scrippsiella hangoei-like, Strain SHHI-4" /NCGR_SAMPLE_ID=MMETSP0368 /ASSEMBLY_ACC=CAM_ASM_000363 /LENGTH=316 /DNA_ID=CAMNT_0018781973 /DNA_START=55 /DNA_END=1005 /DNA_ORIENTATION=-
MPLSISHLAAAGDQNPYLPLIASYAVRKKEDAVRLLSLQRSWKLACAPDGKLKVPKVIIDASREKGLVILDRCLDRGCKRLELTGSEERLPKLLDAITLLANTGRWCVPCLTVRVTPWAMAGHRGSMSRFGQALSSAIRALEERPSCHALGKLKLHLKPISNADADGFVAALVGKNPLEIKLQVSFGQRRIEHQLLRKGFHFNQDRASWMRIMPGTAVGLSDHENCMTFGEFRSRMLMSIDRLEDMCFRSDPQERGQLVAFVGQAVADAARGSSSRWGDDVEEIDELDAVLSTIFGAAGSASEALQQLAEYFGPRG